MWRIKIEVAVSLNRLIYTVPTSTMASTILAEICRQDLLDLNSPPLASITDVKHFSSL